MLMEVGEFCDRVETDLAGLIDELILITNRHNPNEILSWQRSLPKLSIALSQQSLQDFHLLLGQSGGLSLEYRLPASSAWCDAVLLGKGNSLPAAVIIELKDWDADGIRPTTRENLIDYHGAIISHPSDQVRGYVEYCQNFHSVILSSNASTTGCVFFTNAKDLTVLSQSPYESLVSQYPIFSSREPDIHQQMPEYLSRYLLKPDYDFAREFEAGYYAQNRNFIEQMAKLILDDSKTIFVLLDEQRKGYELCLEEIENILKQSEKKDDKAVIIIEGPPGSGKSVLAAKLWASLSKNLSIDKSIVFTTTSMAQNTNWSELFQKQSKSRLGRGVILKSNQYNPGLSPIWVKRNRKPDQPIDILDWHNNIKLFFLKTNPTRMPDNQIGISIVDEAHALIDPSAPNKRGISASGWCLHAGPQGYHIIRASQISIFLMDSLQSYRDNETTTRESIETWAKELNVKNENIKHISLGDAQFRCGGSKEYVSWLDGLLGQQDANQVDTSWRKVGDSRGVFQFEIIDSPHELDERLIPLIKKGKNVRLVASYGREWKSQNVINPHDIEPSKKDFYIPYIQNGQQKYWSRIWNYAPKQEYQIFVQAPLESKMHFDPLCEVGCPYVVRGFDYDYLGVLWLKDLVWRNGEWKANLDNIFESAWQLTLGRARKEEQKGEFGIYTKSVIQQLQRGYRILLSRAINGIFVWFEDEETRDYVTSKL